MRLGEIPQLLRRDDVKEYLGTSWDLCWPLVLIMLFNFIISLTDVFIAGRLGKEVQASYGLVVQFYFILSIVVTALNVGSVSVISQLFTSEPRDEFTLSVRSSMKAALIAGVVLTVVGVSVAPTILGMLDFPASVKNYAVPLLRIYAIGIIFNYILINSNGILRSTNRIKVSLMTMGIACVLNVILNFTLVFLTPLGFRGIGVATVISLAVGALINTLYVRKILDGLRKWSWPIVKKMFRIGWPIGFLQLMWMLGQAAIYLILGALPSHQVEMMAAFTNGMRVEAAVFLLAFAFNFANAVVIGNLLGAKRYEDAYRNGWITAGLGVCVIIALTLVIVVSAHWVMPLLSSNAMVIAESKRYLYIAAIAQPFAAISFILGGGLNGAGDTKSVMLRVAGSVWLIRIPLAYLFAIVLDLGVTSIWWAMALSVVVQGGLIAQRYWSRKWLPKKEQVA